MLVNIVEGGRTPQLSPQELQSLGFSLAIYPVAGMLAAVRALEKAYAPILARRGTRELEGKDLYPFEELCLLMGFQQVWDFDARHAEDGKQ
jgi:2-methylisocitrate lyase-like PEP mutase family enzyme